MQINAPNVHFLGPKPYDQLPGYVRHIDIFVLPWRQDSVFTSYGSAIKVREYLATGKPVVISPLYEYLKIPGVCIYRTTDEFIGAVEEGLYADTMAKRELRQSVVRACTWDVRAQEVASLMTRLLEGRGVSQSATAEEELTAANFSMGRESKLTLRN